MTKDQREETLAEIANIAVAIAYLDRAKAMCARSDVAATSAKHLISFDIDRAVEHCQKELTGLADSLIEEGE